VHFVQQVGRRPAQKALLKSLAELDVLFAREPVDQNCDGFGRIGSFFTE
jgi:hypothetical protein